MPGAATPHALSSHSAAHRFTFRQAATRILMAAALCGITLLLMACPRKQAAVNYADAESGLRLAINVNEVAYNSWNKVYESFGALHRDSQMSEARWAAISAIDGVIVLSEADLIEGIERSKNLLEVWRQASNRVLGAESAAEVNQLREHELEARQRFNVSMEYLNTKSLKLRDSYAEAIILADAVTKEGHPLPTEHVAAIRQIVKMVDQELGRSRAKEKAGSAKQARKEIGESVTSSVK